jgi:hypothetical protein
MRQKGSGPFETEVTWRFSGVLCSFTLPLRAEEHGAWIASGLVEDVDHALEKGRNGIVRPYFSLGASS